MMIGLLALQVHAAEKEDLNMATDITKETIVGPGSVSIVTGKDVMMSFGAMVRIIPTSETDWDFGMGDHATFLGGNLDSGFFRNHGNEAGWVNNSYIRNEDKLYFNAMPPDRRWSFYAALEFDGVLETSSVDARGGKTNSDSNFGLERLNVSMALPANMRFHAGWDIWHLDSFEGASMVYGDDNPGFWITGENDAFSFNAGYFKQAENDYQTTPAALNSDTQDDRDLYAGHIAMKPNDTDTVKLFYAYDRIRSVSVKDLLNVLTGGGTATGRMAKTDSHHVGGYYLGKFGHVELLTEGVYQFGQSRDTGLAQDDFDISAYAFAVDTALEFKGLLTGYPFRIHLGMMYTSGDDDAGDDTLGGYNGVCNVQRFSRIWGGENTIIGDTNFVMGTLIYGYIPELYGNGTPVFTGGVQNGSGFGGGRGDNPGLFMISTGLTMAPEKFLIYNTNINIFTWNEDFLVPNMVTGASYVPVKGEYAGTEWDNELTLALSPNTFIKGQFACLFPGKGVKQVTEALSGKESDDTAIRLAAELIWKF